MMCLSNQIFAARETNIWNVDGKELADTIIGPSTEYLGSLVCQRIPSQLPSDQRLPDNTWNLSFSVLTNTLFAYKILQVIGYEKFPLGTYE